MNMKNIKLFEEFFFKEESKFDEVSSWIEEIYDWNEVRHENNDRVRFDWRNGQMSFWLNSDMSGEGQLPFSIKSQVLNKGIKMKINEGMEKRGPVGYSEEEKKGKFVVSILTQEVLDRHNRKYPDKPKSVKNLGYHMAPVSYEDAVKAKKEWEAKGKYKEETIKSVTLFKQSDIEQGE